MIQGDADKRSVLFCFYLKDLLIFVICLALLDSWIDYIIFRKLFVSFIFLILTLCCIFALSTSVHLFTNY